MRTREEIQSEIDGLSRRLATLQDQLDDAPDLKEPPVGAAIKFTVQFDHDGTVYTYVAYHYKEKWWAITGVTVKYTWGQLCDLIMKDHAVKRGHHKPSFMMATNWGSGR